MAHPKRLLLAARGFIALLFAALMVALDSLASAVRAAQTPDSSAMPQLHKRHDGIAGILNARSGPLVYRPGTSKTGTLSIQDLQAARFQSVASFGQNRISEVFASDLEVHRAILADLLGPLVAFTSDRQRIQGSSDTGAMYEVDEFGEAPTQKVVSGTTVGFPMRVFQYNVGWTKRFLKNATVGEVLDQYTAAKKAHAKRVARQIKRAMYLSGNYTFRDLNVDKVDLAVKRFVNADSAPIQDGPNGEAYDGTTHTHYDANATLTAPVLQAAIRDVVEHGNGGLVHVNFSITDEATVRALTGFTAYQDPRVTLNANANQAEKRLDITRLDNRPIGIFDSAEVWLKPWAIANYALTFDSTTPNKPLVIRTRDGQAPTLELAAEYDTHPLQGKDWESEFDAAVWNRTNGGVLYFASGSYADPVING